MRLKRKIISCICALALAITLVPAAHAHQTPDISNHWAKDQINKMISTGVITGYADGSFRPDNSITRAEFMAIINRAYNFTNEADVSYKDVSNGAWYTKTLKQAKAAGYINGYDDGTMKPDNLITRQEAAVVITKVANIAANVTSFKNFSDASSLPEWSKKAVKATYDNGIMSGYPDGTFKADSNLTRAEAVTLLSKALAMPSAPSVVAPNGTYVGQKFDNVEEYLGIPFAAPVEKWKAPKDVTTTSKDVIRAKEFGPSCLQPYDPTESASFNTATDCLNCNVWTKNSSKKGKPVMVFLYGGSFVQGGGNNVTYNGKGFLNNMPVGEDAVIVNLNYRLGMFGSLDLSSLKGYSSDYKDSLSLWILDEIQALKWVNKNISAFGGDPNNVTVFGQSSGGHSIGYLMTVPEARKYFHRGIMESGSPFFGITTKEIKAEMSKKIFEALGVTSIDQLTSITDADFEKNMWSYYGPNYGTLAARVLDGNVVPEDFWQQFVDGSAKDIDLMIGTTTGEVDTHDFDTSGYPQVASSDKIMSLVYSHYNELGTPKYAVSTIGNDKIINEYLATGDRTQKAADLFNDMATRIGSIYYAEAQSKYNKNTYMYWWNWAPDASKLTKGLSSPKLSPFGRAPHCSELPVLFDSGAFGYGELGQYWLGGYGIDDHIRTFCDQDIVPNQLTKQAVAAWYYFAKTGDPNNKLIPEWQSYNASTRDTMLIDSQWTLQSDPSKQDREILSKIRPLGEISR